MRQFFVCIVMAITFNFAFSQCFETNFAFCPGEVLNYEIYYNWGFVWLNAGNIDFKVNSGTFHDRPIYYFDSQGSTYKSYDWFFKVRDRYQCYLDVETLRPLWFHRENYEGGFEADYKYFFNHSDNVVYSYTQNSERPFKKDTVEIPPCTFDLLSLIYYSRNIDFSDLHAGDSIPIISIIDNEVYNLYIRYLGKEVIENKFGEEYNCIKFSALLVEGTIFKDGEDLLVWVSDDKNRIPILVEAKILVGSIKAYLSSMEGVRNPVESLVK